MSSGFYDPCRKRRLVESIETSGLTEHTWRWGLANWTCEISASVPVSLNSTWQKQHFTNTSLFKSLKAVGVKKKTPKHLRLKKTPKQINISFILFLQCQIHSFLQEKRRSDGNLTRRPHRRCLTRTRSRSFLVNWNSQTLWSSSIRTCRISQEKQNIYVSPVNIDGDLAGLIKTKKKQTKH